GGGKWLVVIFPGGSRFDVWRGGRRRFRSGNRSRIALPGCFNAYYFGGGRVLALDKLNLQSKPNRRQIFIVRSAIIRGAPVGAAAAELIDGALDSAIEAAFLAVEAVQELIRAGITSRDEGEAAGVVKVAIPLVIPDIFFVFVFVE